MLAKEALSLSGASAVHIYLWDPAGGFLYGAGAAGSGGDRLDSIGLPLGEGTGFIFFHGCHSSRHHRERLRSIARRVARQLSPAGERLRSSPLDCAEEATTAFISALRVKSSVTAQHCARVARYAAATALAMGCSEAGICHVERCALLHDIGKMGIAEEILEKRGSLTPSEWTQMVMHPHMGVRVIRSCRSLEGILPAVAMHHERFDGRGYPSGAKGYDIPLEARIVNVCDAYDTMTSDRPYRKSLDPEEARRRLRASAGTQFDPTLVEVFTVEVLPTLSNRVLQATVHEEKA